MSFLSAERLSHNRNQRHGKDSTTKQSIKSIERSIEIIKKKRNHYSQSGWQIGLFGQYYEKLGRTLQNVYALSKEEKMLPRAIEAYENANLAFKKVDLPTHIAEAFWHIAQLQGQLGRHKEASQSYLSWHPKRMNFLLKRYLS